MVCMRDKAKGVGRVSGYVGALQRARRYTDDIRSHLRPGAHAWTPRKGSGSLSKQSVGNTPWCFTDALMMQLTHSNVTSALTLPAH